MTYANTSIKDDYYHYDEITVTRICDRVGSNLVNKYVYKLYCENVKHKAFKDRPYYTNWKSQFVKVGDNQYLFTSYFKNIFVSKLIDTLDRVLLVKVRQVRTKYDSQRNILQPIDMNIREKFAGNQLHSVPYRIPMVVEPKSYGDGILGGYLLNGDKYDNNIIIRSSDLKYRSQLQHENKVYNLVNGVMKVPYKINTELLDFILDKNNNTKYNLLLDKFRPHKF